MRTGFDAMTGSGEDIVARRERQFAHNGPVPQSADGGSPTANILFIDPSYMPEWYWMPVAWNLRQRGHNVYYPRTPRSDMEASMEQEVQAVERCVKGVKNLHIVTTSGGVEIFTRFCDPRRGNLDNVEGATVFNSGGPKGDQYDPISPKTGKPMRDRHPSDFNDCVSHDEDGREILDPAILDKEVKDPVLRKWISKYMVGRRPMTKAEIDEDIQIVTNDIIPIQFVYGKFDKFHELVREIAMARQLLKTEPIPADFGHLPGLTHHVLATEFVLRGIHSAHVARLRQNMSS